MGWSGSAWRVLLIKTSLIVINPNRLASLSDQATNNIINDQTQPQHVMEPPSAPRHHDICFTLVIGYTTHYLHGHLH